MWEASERGWEAGPGARVYLTNQGHTRIHPSEPGRGASLRQTYRLAEGACAQAMMEPVMLYEGAEFTSVTDVSLAPGALWVSADIVCPGRVLRGESFAFRKYDARLNVCYRDELIYRSRMLLEPGRHRVEAPGAWEDKTHCGILYAFSDRLTAAQLDAAREAAEAAGGIASGACVVGASLTYRHGLVVTAAGGAAWQLQRALTAAWQAIRLSLDGLPPLALTASR